MKTTISVCLLAAAMISCNDRIKQESVIQQAKQMTIDSIAKAEVVKKTIVDSMKEVASEKQRPEKVVVHTTSTDGNNTTTTITETKKKKGWSSTAKGAVIGAGVGAITGAMVDKKKGEGAIVGGILGAGAGAGVGAIIDGKKKKE